MSLDYAKERKIQIDPLPLVETVNPALLSKIDTMKNDPDIIEGMMEHEPSRLFRRIMLMGEERITAAITPRFLSEVLLRTGRGDLERQAYTIERTATQEIPVFDNPEVVRTMRFPVIATAACLFLCGSTPIAKYAAGICSSSVLRYSSFGGPSYSSFCPSSGTILL